MSASSSKFTSRCVGATRGAPSLVQRWQLGLECARDRRVTKTSLAVILVIGDHVNRRTGEAFPSTARVARLAGITTRTARRGIRQLVALGYLAERRVPGRTTRYRLVPLGAAEAATTGNAFSGGRTAVSGGSDTCGPAPLAIVSPEPATETTVPNTLDDHGRRDIVARVVHLPLPPGLNRTCWQDYVVHTEQLAGAPKLTVESAEGLLRRLAEAVSRGRDGNAILVECVARNRHALFATANQSCQSPGSSSDELFEIAAERLAKSEPQQ